MEKTKKRNAKKAPKRQAPGPVAETSPPANAEEGTGKLQIVEKEIKFARLLASNDPKTRSRVLKNLKKWLTLRSEGSYRKLYCFLLSLD